jgi:hypothetical protein
MSQTQSFVASKNQAGSCGESNSHTCLSFFIADQERGTLPTNDVLDKSSSSSDVSAFSAAGSVPVKWLSPRCSALKFVRRPSVRDIVPDILLACRKSRVKLLKLPNHAGSVPVSVFSDRLSSSSAVSALKLSGMRPLSWLPHRLRILSLRKLPQEGGMPPDSEFLARSIFFWLCQA